MSKRICCPIDFSDVSRIAVEEAAELALWFGAAITLLHVDERRSSSTDVTAVGPGATSSRELLGTWRMMAEEMASSRVQCASTVGDPAREILRFAEEGGYHIIVMGTHGRTGRGSVPFGSVAQKVILDAPCPVLVTNERTRASRETWTRRR
jgi:nucleotide-binding universal stress UspA family protein